MNIDFKNIYIGSLIKQRVLETGIETERICKFFKCTVEQIDQMFLQELMDTDTLLKWCKLLEYDFFRVYSQHLILYAPPAKVNYSTSIKKKESQLPQFRKNIYTKEVIDFILESLEYKEKTKEQIINDYKIPKTTLYNWIKKYAARNKAENQANKLKLNTK
ncbi:MULTISPECIES: transposase [Chryseobacterium]|uniref:Transposase n=1 Tax=Chryseobacterium bernardetii TaxID=1241978 RepID=A0A3G6TA64_9FLAO|nr:MULTISPECIES: transposase [Chryseobacterium]AZB26165.1 transposase [Chryseobacterium bernardetii]UCA60425.1 transposase [Chryseobacterium rhizoplanae]